MRKGPGLPADAPLLCVRSSYDWMVLPDWIEQSTPSLPMKCSTTELWRLRDRPKSHERKTRSASLFKGATLPWRGMSQMRFGVTVFR